jgi:tape measure domain-containing protein
MNGINIPIGGDMAPFLAAVAELKVAMQDLSASIRGTLGSAAKAANDTSRGMMNAATGASRAKSSFQGLFGTLSNVGMGVANIAAGAKGIRSAFNFISGLSGNWRSVAKAALAAAAAVAGVVIAAKLAGAAFRTLMGVARGVWGSIKAGANSAASAVKGAFSNIAGAVPGGGLLAPLLGIAGIAGSIMLLKSQLAGGFDLAGEIERTGVALTALTGSAPEAARVMDEMRKTYLRTGTDIAEQSGTIRKFIALGFSTDDAMKLQKNILDVAGAVGLTSAEAGQLGSALAQVQAKGIVSMEELRQQIAEKGIPVFDLLAKKLGVTQAELMKLVGDGKVPSEALLSIFLNMEGALGKFSGGAERMGMTFTGLVARMRGAWELLRAEFIAPIADSLKPILDAGIAKLETFKEAFRAAGKAIGDTVLATFALIQSGRIGEAFSTGMTAAISVAVDLLMRGVKAATATLAAGLAAVFIKIQNLFTDPLMKASMIQLFGGLGQIIAGEIKAAVALTDKGRKEGALLTDTGRSRVGAAGTNFGQAMDRQGTAGEFLLNMLTEMGIAGKEAFGVMGEDAKQAIENYKSLTREVSNEVDALRAKFAPPAEGGKENAFSPTTGLGEAVKTAVGQAMTLTTSLGRVGGGGFGRTFLPMVSETKKSNQLLGVIARNTANFAATPAIV